MARELPSYNIRVNTLMPGAVSGANMESILQNGTKAENPTVEEIEQENYTDVAALKRWVSFDEVARAALFFTSDLSSAVTGDW